MKVAVVGATGHIGDRLCRDLLAAGHQVRALSRGGPALAALVELGAEPFPGSFDEGTSGLDAFFKGVDAAFTMVRSDWSNVEHYPTVAGRLAQALAASPVSFIVNLSAMGADLKENAAHSTDFYLLEAALNGVSRGRIVHVRGGWFMENFLAHASGVALRGTVASTLHLDVKLPCVAIRDISRAMTREFLHPAQADLTIREVQGPEDLTLPDAVRLMSETTGTEIGLSYISYDRADVRDAYLRRGGTKETWEYRSLSDKAFNDRRARFHQPRSSFDRESTRFADFLRDTWLPHYRKAVAQKGLHPEHFDSWLSQFV